MDFTLQPLIVPLLVAVIVVLIIAGVTGTAILRRQWLLPLRAVQDELRTAARDLQQTSSDLTTARDANDTLRGQLQQSGVRRSDFLTAMGYKLRTPLNSIAGYSDLLQSGVYGDLNDLQKDRLHKIRRNSDTLLALINDMLDINRMNVGQMPLNMASIRLAESAQTALQLVEPQRAERNLPIETDVPPDLLAIGDSERICQVLMQMLDNALKFTDSGSITLRGRALQVVNGKSAQFTLPTIGWLMDGEWSLMEVTDTGIGIAPEDQAQVFDEFYQAEPGSREVYGTGLGLTVARRLVELHQGTMWLKSAPGAGTTFYIALRAAPAL